MKIRKLQLKNIGVFDDETIEFHPCPAKDKAEIHILTGQNGSGKTTILQALVWYFGQKEVDSIVTDEGIYQHAITNPDFHKKFLQSYAIKMSVEPSDFNNSKEGIKTVRFAKYLGYSKDILTDLSFAVFAYSGYRRLKNEKINLFDETEENPLYQSLDFVKDENSKFTINQWLGRNLSKRALALEDNSNEAKNFTENVKNLEKVIYDIVGYDIRFKLKTDLSLVLIKDSQELDFDVLPDGLKSLISWIGDL